MLFAPDVLVDLMAVGSMEGEPLDEALDRHEVKCEKSIQAVYASKIGTRQERLEKVRDDYGIRARFGKRRRWTS